MSLQPGTRLGAFEVLGLLGRGGMGEVYRARDTRLLREVALKVLPDHHKSDPQRLARFKRESLVLASLAHPHIATLFDIEESGPVTALVMELVDGDTLAERIARGRGRGLPHREAFAIARQIAEALAAAHSRGIAHRDLKPANVKIGRDGLVKVLDFGLASVYAAEAHADATPTVTVTEGEPGVMGTPPYMSPEQVRGEPLDHRTDIWSFGCVLYEMLTGRRAFDGPNTAGVIASVLEREPDLTALPADAPGAIRRLLRRSLSKSRDARLRDMGDALLEINDALTGTDEGTPVPVRKGTLSGRFHVPMAAVAGAVAAGLAIWILARPGPAAAPAIQFPVAVPADAPLVRSVGARNLAISPDGARIAFQSARGLAIRSLGRLDMETLDIGNETAESPFFSPDGRWIGYTAAPGLAIRKVSVTGGSPVTIAQVAAGASGSWGAGRIVFADATGLYRLPEGGGTPETLSITLEPNEQAAFPEILPGGEVVLFTVLPIRTNLIGPSSGSAQARIDALDLRTGVQSTIVAGGGRPRYARSGHLLYASRGTVYAVAFDVERLQTRGERVQVSADWGSAQFDVSDDGTLAYLSGQVLWESELVWVDHNGQDESLGAPLGQYSYARLSPDGTRVALDGYVVANREMFIWDIPGKRLERLTTDPAEDAVPVWSPDGKRLVFSSARYGYTNVFWQAADGSGTPEQLLKRDYVQFASNFTPDGQLFVSGQDPDRDWDVFVLSVDGSQKMLPLITGKGLQTNPEISKDGKWIAYQSNQSGQYEVYVRPYPQVDGGRWQISLAGGKEPLWSLDGRKLYYKDFTGALMAVTVTPSPAFSAGVPSKLIDGPPYRHEDSRLSARTYDLSLDGSRFLMIKLKNQPKPVQIVVTTNWFTELNAQLPLH